jgi:KDO2-lipid IV(A) lauroyltransferase
MSSRKTKKEDSVLHPKYLPSWLGVLLMRLLALLPYRLMMLLAERLGRLFNRLLKRRRIVAQTNIDLCFTEKSARERQIIVEQTMISMAKGFFETLLAWWGPDTFFAKHCRYEGLDLILDEQKKGRGVILIGAHYSTLDLSGRAMARMIDVDITYKKQRNKVMDELILKNREKFFGNAIEKQAMRTMIKNLKKGRCVWYAPDQDFGRKESVFAPFFGVPTATLSNIGKIIKLTGAKPLYFEHIRLNENGKTIYYSHVYDPFNDGFTDDDVHNATLINKAIEESVRQHPDQYFWHHERFRTRPNRDDPKIYPRKNKKKKKRKAA